MPYTVSPIFFCHKAPLMSKKRKNFSTRVLKRRAGMKWPSSWSTIRNERLKRNWPALTRISMTRATKLTHPPVRIDF